MGKQITQQDLEERLKFAVEMYNHIDSAFDVAWAALPDFPGKKEKGQKIRDMVINSAELEGLMDGFQNNRPPKFMLVGRTGVGKSSLINALCGTYRAQVSDTAIMTDKTEIYEVKRDGKTILHVLDTRGIAEGSALNAERAEKTLQEAVLRFQPDVILFLCRIELRDNSVNADVREIQKLTHEYKRRFGVPIPVISVLTGADGVPPRNERFAAQYSRQKKDTIEKDVRRYQDVFSNLRFQPEDIVPVSSYIDWGRSNEELNKLKSDKIEGLVPKEDCRYNIDELINAITACLPSDAAMGFCMVAKLEIALQRIARRVVNAFATIAASVAATPIPFADMPLLWALEVSMVILVAAIAGEKLSANAAKKFLFSVAGVMGVGFFAQQLSRFLNATLPLSGSACSAAVAAGTMRLLGEAAIRHYINHEEIGKIRKGAKKQIGELLTPDL
ncbi:MAG: 50S ribosome-binding GTPase [Oscillibacter sp.]|nr:50S ribosome-binding GTPase [Oscillibacter sp.]